MSKAKRRPGRDQHHELHEDHSEHSQEAHHQEKSMSDETPGATSRQEEAVHAEEIHTEKNKIEINFPGSELLRAKLPRPFEVAEKVATEWVNDGNFEGLPLGHPLAQILAAQGLKKAKEVEKKVVASGVIEKVATQAFTFGMKAQQEITNIREQVKSKFGKK